MQRSLMGSLTGHSAHNLVQQRADIEVKVQVILSRVAPGQRVDRKRVLPFVPQHLFARLLAVPSTEVPAEVLACIVSRNHTHARAFESRTCIQIFRDEVNRDFEINRCNTLAALYYIDSSSPEPIGGLSLPHLSLTITVSLLGASL